MIRKEKSRTGPQNNACFLNCMLDKQMMYRFLTKDKIPFFLFCLLGITIPQPFHLERLVVVLLFICGTFILVSRSKEAVKRNYLYFPALIPVLFIVMHAAGLLYSEDLTRGWQNIETKLALLVVPLYASIVWNDGLSPDKINRVLLCFVISSFTAYIYILLRASLLLLHAGSTQMPLSLAFSRDNLAGYLSQHPIYIALIAACCIQVLFYFLMKYWKDNSLVKKFAILIALITSFGIIILMGARMSLIAITLTVLMWLSIIIIRQRKFIMGFTLLVLFIIAIAAAVIYVPNIRTRFKEIAETEFAPPKGAYHNSTNLRVGQLYCSIEVIKDNYWWGTGTGDYQIALNKCYKQNNFSDVLYLLNYNSHNQYLQSLLTLGVFGLALFLATLLVPLRLSIKNNDWLIIMLFIVLSMGMLTESVLQTNKGIMIFSFVYGLFIIRSKSDNKQAIT